MTSDSDHLNTLLHRFGVSLEAADVYQALYRFGPSGIMDIVRATGIGRNVAYRLIDELQAAQLVSIVSKSFGKEYTARGPEAFEAIVTVKEAEISQLRAEIDIVAANLQALTSNASSSKILQYEGLEGLKQVNWNLTRSRTMIRVYEQSHVDEYTDEAFAQRLRDKLAEAGNKHRDLTNREYTSPYLENSDIDYWLSHSEYRHVSPEILNIQFEMYIYNDTTTLLDYTSKQAKAVEIINPKLAQMQRQIYDAVWSQATPMSQREDHSWSV